MSRPIREVLRWVQRDANRRAARQFAVDALEGASRVVRSMRIPSRQGLRDYVTHQIMVNVIAWTAGMLAAGLVKRFFEVRGFRNLWGLAASRSRTLVSADDYHLIMTLAGFGSGLLMMILVRHVLLRWVEETRTIRMERRGGGRDGVGRASVAIGSLSPDFEAFGADHDS